MPNMFNNVKNPKQGLLGKPTVSQTPQAEDTQKKWVPNDPADKAYLYGQRKAQERLARDYGEHLADPTKIRIRAGGLGTNPNFYSTSNKKQIEQRLYGRDLADTNEIPHRLSDKYPIEQLERKKRIEANAKGNTGSFLLGKASGGAAKAMEKGSKISTAEKNPKHKNCW
jgi:hypothetical protein